MADIAITAAQIGLVRPQDAIVKSYTAAAAITKGQAIYVVATTGKAGVADANDAGKQQFRGIALNSVAAAGIVDVCEEGELYGFTLAGNYDSLAYLSDTAGALADAAGTMTVNAGRVVSTNDKSLTKVLRVEANMLQDWS